MLPSLRSPRAVAGAGVASITALVAGFLRTMFGARAMTATTLLGVLAVVSIGTGLVPQAFPNRVDTANAQEDAAAAHLAGPARAAEPILLALQTAVPAAAPKAGEPVIDEKSERQIKSGLDWLASQQADDGSLWHGKLQRRDSEHKPCRHRSHGRGLGPWPRPYHVRVEKGLRYVLKSASPRGSSRSRRPKSPTARCTSMPSECCS